MTMKASIKTKDPLDKRVPKSKKYEHITGRLNTGLTQAKVKVITVREFSRRRDEIYYRLQPEMLETLYMEYEHRDEIGESLGHMGTQGNSGGPTIITHQEMARPIYDRPYLLLDVRDERDYASGHLLHARSFPHVLLRRDQLHPDIYSFRNKEERLIILYCDKEEVSRDAAKMMVDRGIDNIFLLTGGFHEFASKYSHRVEGEMPDLPVSPNRAPSRKHRQHRAELEAIKAGHGSIHRLDTISEGGRYESNGNPVYKDEEGGRAPYSLSTARSPNVSERVAKALAEHRREREDVVSRGDYMRQTPSDYSENGLNSARLREHNRAQVHGHSNESQRGGYSARGSPQRSAFEGRGDRERDARSEAGYSTHSTRSVADTVIDRAMRAKGKGMF